ncbi:LOW QUALITY PROTEIN: hypothetical protein CVT26_014086 [Gymnopilus dilepis]|uniref:Uncharacterized protein n=1 Tax=Gymnopilus dilepis TaxID=231916 RepID=A0A409VXA3_9AGAR|nr:LOW QUALITY PROTEIN: hypothetical protein CVT26_014086 [Gymnopilus dilepis]
MQRPKTAAEILAAAKPAPPKRQRQRAQTESVIPVAQMSMFSSSEPIINPPSASSPARPTFQSGPAHSLNTVQFMTPLTQIRFEQKLGRADEGTRGSGGESRNSDILSHSDVPMSEPDAKAEVIERKPLISRIEEVLALLRGGRLSPFDLVLELLDEYNPEYSGYRTEFYKEENQKLFNILDLIFAQDAGRRKLCTWFKRSEALDIVCEIIGDEMDAVKKVEQISGGLSAVRYDGSELEFPRHNTRPRSSPEQKTATQPKIHLFLVVGSPETGRWREFLRDLCGICIFDEFRRKVADLLK